MKYDVVALGELLIDFTSQPNDAQGSMNFLANPGGAPANLLATVSKLGYKTAFLGKVGADLFGENLRETLTASNIATEGLIMDADFFTTLAFVRLDAEGDRSFDFARKPGADTMLFPHEIKKAIIKEARIFHFGSLSLTHEPARTSTQAALAIAKEAGILISYDPNLRLALWPDAATAQAKILWGLEQCHWLKISQEECNFLWPEKGQQEQLATIFQRENIDIVLLTNGAEGAILATRKNQVAVRAPQVTCCDTTGAGDICGGAALSRFLDLYTQPKEAKLKRQQMQNLSLDELTTICRFAVAAGSLSTQKRGAIPSIPGKNDIIAFEQNQVR